MPVVDASALVELLLDTGKGDQVAKALEEGEIAAPELIDVEVLSTLARLVRADELPAADATAAARLLPSASVTRVTHAVLDQRAWQLRDRVRIADAFYVACAERFHATLVTADARLARAPLPGVSILLVR